jgi:C4-dicarboxylate transporter DctQ subunit
MVMQWWDRVEQTLVGILGALTLVVGMVQVVGRYLDPEHAISWAEEVIVYLAVWAVMIISSQLVRTDGHVRPDLVLRVLPPQAQRWVEVFNCLVALTFCGGMVWYGWQIVDTSMLLDERSSTGLEFPMWIYYASLPTGGALMFIRYVMRLVRFALFFDPRTMSVGHSISHEVPLDMQSHGGH